MNSESEISFKDLVFYIFRNILIVFIAGAIVGCAFGLKAYFVKSTTNDVLDVSKKLNASETDYQYQDVEQLRIRMEAFSEMLVQKRYRRVKKVS